METLSYYKPGTWVYTLNNDRIVLAICVRNDLM
jgi:hypothetical protein|nr:MAG TPA: hypothetical protein [Caudoviricetes sp.]